MSNNDDPEESLNFPEENRDSSRPNSDGEEISQENITRAVEQSFINRERWSGVGGTEGKKSTKNLKKNYKKSKQKVQKIDKKIEKKVTKN